MKYVVKARDRYYRDTRGEPGHGGCSDIFTSSPNLDYATFFRSKESAEEWAAEFLQDFPWEVECVTRSYEALGFKFELDWQDQTCTITSYPGTVPVVPISLIALILQRFGGFRIALNPHDWVGVELKNNVKLPESPGGSS